MWSQMAVLFDVFHQEPMVAYCRGLNNYQYHGSIFPIYLSLYIYIYTLIYVYIYIYRDIYIYIYIYIATVPDTSSLPQNDIGNHSGP